MSEHQKVWAIVPAAGAGKRMGSEIPKQYLTLSGRPLLAHTCEALLRHSTIESLILVVAADDDRWEEAVGIKSVPSITTVHGGRERCHSVFNGLKSISDRAAPDDWVLVHDAARPCLSYSDLDHLLKKIEDDPVGGLLGTPVRDTMKRSDAGARVVETVDRALLWHALTPQVFRYALLTEALAQIIASNAIVTDEAAAVERMGFNPVMVQGSSSNLKVTRPDDLPLAEWYLNQQKERAS